MNKEHINHVISKHFYTTRVYWPRCFELNEETVMY